MKPFASLPAEHQRILRHGLKSVDEPMTEVAVADRDSKGLGVWAPARGNDEYIVRHDASGKTITAKGGEQVELPPELVSKHTNHEWKLFVESDRLGKRCFIVWHDMLGTPESQMYTIGSFQDREADAQRAVNSVNACRDMSDPAKEIQAMRETLKKIASQGCVRLVGNCSNNGVPPWRACPSCLARHTLGGGK